MLRAADTAISCLPGSYTLDPTPSGAGNDEDPSRNARVFVGVNVSESIEPITPQPFALTADLVVSR
jgi:hypothetical protein